MVCEGVEVARTSATVKEKVECVQRNFDWATGSPNIYNSGEPRPICWRRQWTNSCPAIIWRASWFKSSSGSI